MTIATNRDYLNFSKSLSRRGRIGDRKKHHSLGLKSFGPLPEHESRRNCQRCCFVPQIHSSAPKFKNTRTSTKRSYEHFRIFASGRGENLHNQQWLPRQGSVQFMFMGLYQVQYKNWSAMRIVLRIKPCVHQASSKKHTISIMNSCNLWADVSACICPWIFVLAFVFMMWSLLTQHQQQQQNNNKIKTTEHQQKQQQQ